MGRLQNWALFLLIMALPFNGVPALLNIGELENEGFFYVAVLYLALFALNLGRYFNMGVIRSMFQIQFFYILLIVLSLFLGLEAIELNRYGPRTGIERYVVSVFVYVAYFGLACALLMHGRRLGWERFVDLVSRAFVFTGIVLVLVCSFELVTWVSPPLREVWSSLRAIISVNTPRLVERLSGLSLEPSFNAFALLACIPWTYYRSTLPGSPRTLLRLLTWLLVLLCVVSGARTAYAGLAIMGISLVLARGWMRQAFVGGWDGAVMVLVAFLFGLLVPLLAGSLIDADQTTSNVTRGYLTATAILGGWERLLGQGFGQSGFFVVQQSSATIQYSWELLEFFQGSRYGELPPIYSWFARSFSEFGLFGYAVLAMSYAAVVKAVYRVGHAAKDDFSRKLFLVTAMLIGQLLAIAFSIESIRVPQIWFAWVFISIVLFQAKEARASFAPAKLAAA